MVDNESSDIEKYGSATGSLDWLSGGGEMGALIRAFDWSKTALGPAERWPQSLRSAVSICLPSKAQIILCWGPELITLYNDGYRPVFGAKHPHVLGLPVSEAWRELWPQGLKEYFEGVLATGEAFWANDLPFSVERHGYPEEAFFDVSYDPVRDESGKAGGIFCIVNETTGRVVGERRLRTLRDLGTRTADAKSVEEVIRLAREVVGENPHDLPFAFFYIESRPAGADDPPSTAWPIGEASSTGKPVIVDRLDATLGPHSSGPWPEPAQSAVVLPIVRAGAGAPHGFLIAGVSPRRRLDADYLTFFELVASQIASAVANVLAYEEERKRAEALAEIDRAKTHFFSNVSHEFRTPLTLMLGPLEELKSEFGRSAGALSVPQYQQVDLIHRNGLRLLKLVNTLLDFSRIEAGRVQAVYEPTDIAAHTAELASVFRSAVEKAGLALIVDCASLEEPAYVDREMWEKIVLNLLANAFKFTFEGEIEVSLRKSATHFELKVRDTGTGIPADEIPKLFERFHRVVGARGRTLEGSGIGLALVQDLARLHGGSVTVESVYGKGSIFRTFIPVGRSHLPEQQIGAARTQPSTALGTTPFVEEALRWLPNAVKNEPTVDDDLRFAEHAQAAHGRRARIVLADDNADMCDYVRRLLGGRFEVETVADGEQALAAIARNKPDLVLSDVMMPRMDGLALVQRLRADPATSILPIILLSARAGDESMAHGLGVGADDYLIKPFSAHELLARVAANISAAKVRREANDALRESEQQTRRALAELKLTYDQSPVGMLQLDPDLRYVRINERLAAMNGFSAADHIGKTIHEIVPELTPKIEEAFRRVIASGEPVLDIELVGETAASPGEQHTWLESWFPLKDEDGRIVGLNVVAQDITEQKRAIGQLQESEERFRNMADNAPVMIWVTEPDSQCSYLSKTWLEFTGQTPENGLGRGWLKAIHPDDRSSAEKTFIGANVRREPFQIDYRLRRHDGEYRWAIDSASPRFGPAGDFLGFIGSVIDIAERKRAEETQRLLLNELNHRVKNTLASVQAIVQTTLKHTSDPAVFAMSFAGRIQSLARVHSLLTEESWQGTDLHVLVRDQVLNGPGDESRLDASGPAVKLQPQMALHLALMLHELGTNSIKHGALSVAKGRVTIEWSVKDHVLSLRWIERGGPPVKAAGKRGFGTTLIEQTARSDGGRAQMRFEAGGITWKITLPLPSDFAIRSEAETASREPAKEEPHKVGEPQAVLAGRRIIVIEDEPLVALDLADSLTTCGAEVIGPVGTEKEALALIESTALSAALLDGNLHGRPVDDIAAALTRHKIPFVFVTGYKRESLVHPQ